MPNKARLVLTLFTFGCILNWNVVAGTKEAATYYERALTEYNKEDYKRAEIQLLAVKL